MLDYNFRSSFSWQPAKLALLLLIVGTLVGIRADAVRPQGTSRGLYEITIDRAGPSDPGRLWFTELQANRIGSYDLGNNQFKEFRIPRPNSSPRGLLFDRRSPQDAGTVWFTEFEGYRLGKLDVATGVVTELPSLGTPAYPLDLVLDRSGEGDPGRIWFSLHGRNKIGRLDLGTEAVTTFDLPSPEPAPIGIFFERPAGVDAGYLWVAQASDRSFTGRIFRFDVATASFREYSLGSTENAATRVIADRRGAGDVGFLWVNELTGANIIRVDLATREIVKRRVIGNSFFLHRVLVLDRTPDPGGRVFIWFSDAGGNRVGRMNGDTGELQFFGLPPGPGWPVGMVLDRKSPADAGRIWFAENQRDRLGMINLASGELQEIEMPPGP